MNVYSVDIEIVATLYIKAENEEEALLKAKPMSEAMFDLDNSSIFSGLSFDHPDLPEVSLSPAMTGQGYYDEVNPNIELVAEDVPPIYAAED